MNEVLGTALACARLQIEPSRSCLFLCWTGYRGGYSSVGSGGEEGAGAGAPEPCGAGAGCAPAAAWNGFEATTVEMACLKMSCSWLLVSSTTEYLSKLLMRPESFTPLIR